MTKSRRKDEHGGATRRLWSDASAALLRELFDEQDLEVADIAERFDCGLDVVRKMLTRETYKSAGGPVADPADPRLKPYRQQPVYSDEEVRAAVLAYADVVTEGEDEE